MLAVKLQKGVWSPADQDGLARRQRGYRAGDPEVRVGRFEDLDARIASREASWQSPQVGVAGGGRHLRPERRYPAKAGLGQRLIDILRRCIASRCGTNVVA